MSQHKKWMIAGGLVAASIGIYLRYLMALHGEPSSIWLFQSIGILS